LIIGGEEMLKGEPFADFEKIRLEVLKSKIQAGLEEFKDDPRKQWTPLRLEKPLLETLLRLVENEERR
jgi:hypothetical protein